MNPRTFTSSAYSAARSRREGRASLVKEVWTSTSVKLPGMYSMFSQVRLLQLCLLLLVNEVNEKSKNHQFTPQTSIVRFPPKS